MSTNVVKADITVGGDEGKSIRGSKSTAKVAFFGIFGIQNLGNECTLQAIVHNARERLSDAQFCAISFNPADTLRRHNLAAFPMSYQDFSRARPGRLAKVFRILFKRIPGELMDWARAVKDLRGTNLVVMTGTGMLTDYSTTAFGFPYHVFRWALAARLAGCKVRFVGVGVGPIYQRLSRKFIRWALTLADYRSFRDEFSRHRIASVFDSSRDYVFPDLAFSLPKSIFPARQNRGRQKQQIGLGIMDHRDIHLLNIKEQEAAYSAYLDKMCEFVEWLVKHDYQVRILQGDARHDVAPRAELKSRLEQRGVRYEEAGILDEGSSSVAELLDQIAQVDVVISPRFHNLLLGMMMNIPAISISYDPKNDALLESVGLGRYRQALFELDVRILIRHFVELQERIQEIKPMISKSADEYRRLLDKQYDLTFGDI
jgi:polysaccharide pyruvyl transferase WcaK-like protein